MRRAVSALAVMVAATGCEPPTLVISPRRPEMAATAGATPRASRPAGSVAAPPGSLSEEYVDDENIPVPATPTPTPDMARDLRRVVVKVYGSAPNLSADTLRGHAYVVVQSAIACLSAAPPPSPYRPQWILSAAEGFVLLHRVLARDPIYAHRAPDARQRAISHYQMLVNDYPRWCAVPNADPAKSTGCGDEALYYLALEQEREGNIAAARGNYSRLIRDWPASRLVPSAHLGLGELFLAESNADPSRLRLAELAYRTALGLPPPNNVIHGYAQLQLGEVCVRKGDRAEAVKAFQAAIAWAGSHPSAPGSGPVATEAKAARMRLGAP